MAVKIRGQRMWRWRAVDDEGEVLDMLAQRLRHIGAGCAIAAQVAEAKWHSSREFHNGQTRFLPNRIPGASLWRSTPTGPHARQQSSGELASGHSATRAQTTKVQIATFSAEVSRDSRRRPQQLQRSKTPDPPVDPAPVSGQCRLRLGGGDRSRLSDGTLLADCAFGYLT
jgi:hypothetical protein